MDNITISKKEYERLKDQDKRLNLLDEGGVRDWVGYRSSLKQYIQEKRVDATFEEFIMTLHEIMTEADVSEPAGRGCGYSIDFNEFAVREILEQFLKDMQRIESGE